MADIITQDAIETKIWTIRGVRVMLDRDLAVLHGVETRALNQVVRRNADRFPDDFMFQLTAEEFENLKSQIVISSWGGVRKLPLAFTDYGIAMLSGLLNSQTAIKMRAFTRLRQAIADHSDIRNAIRTMEKRLNVHDRQIQIAFDAIKGFLQPKAAPKERFPDSIQVMTRVMPTLSSASTSSNKLTKVLSKFRK